MAAAVNGREESLWIARAARDERRRAFDALDRDLDVDVAIVGGGIVGAAAAMLLTRRLDSVALVEARRVGSGNTGLSTAKATLFHGGNFHRLVQDLGAEDARSIIDGERAGLDIIHRSSIVLGMPDAAAPVHHWAYADTDEGIDALEREFEAADGLGITLEWAAPDECPFGARALGLPAQLNLDPVRLVDAFAHDARVHGGEVFERTRIVEVEPGSTCVLRTDRDRLVRCRHLVLATQLPILDRSVVFAGATYHRSHVVALEHARAIEYAPDMYTGIDAGGLSVRSARDTDETPLLVFAGRGHALATDEDGTHVDELEQAARELVPGMGRRRWSWLAHDVMPSDGRPFVGPIIGHDNIHVATGFAGWGLAAGVSAALTITGLIERGHASWHEAQDASRLGAYVRPDAIKEGAHSIRTYVVDRMGVDDSDVAAATLGLGEGTIIKRDGRLVAVARDRDGQLHGVDAACTHRGCIVHFEPEQACWQCPCHGSRFELDGRVLQGPATRPLAGIDVTSIDAATAQRSRR